MPKFRVSEVARIMGVSEDTARRWVNADLLPVTHDASSRMVVEGADLAAFARAQAKVTADDPSTTRRSARNRMVGLVTSVVVDKVMAQVEMQCGSHRVVSLMSCEAVDDLGLAPGSLAVAVIKSTNVVVEIPDGGG